MKLLYVLLLAGGLLLVPEQVAAQEGRPKTLSATYQQTPLPQVLSEAERTFGVKIFYKAEWLEGQKLSLNLTNATLTEVLKAALLETNFSFSYYDAANIVILPADAAMPNQMAGTPENQTNLFDAKALVIGGNKMAPRGQKLTLTGHLKAGKSAEEVVGAQVMVESLGIGTVTDMQGNYKLSLPAGKYEITFKAIGLETLKKVVQLNGNGNLDVEMFEKDLVLHEVRVEAQRSDANVSGTQMGLNKLSIKEIKKMPALLGETDVVKSVQMLPGVTSVGEAASGFNVRGGNTDQNLILMDEVPIFNPTHLFGFFSVFNPDAVQDVTLYRGAIPAQMGGRLSAIMDVKQKEGSYQKWQGTGGIGIVSGRLAVEGPVMNKKGSVLLAGRSSYSNWLFKKLPDAQLRDDKASFYDGTIKFSGLISDRGKVIFSGYRSHDSFQFNADTVYSWETNNASLTYNHIFSEKLQANFVAIYGDYDLELGYLKPYNEAKYNSGIRQRGLKGDFIYQLQKQQLRFGGSSTYYTLSPGVLKPIGERTNIIGKALPKDKAVESAFYVNDEIELNPRFSVNLGLRFSMYQNLGPSQIYTYEADRPRSLLTLTDTVFYANNALVKPYKGLEPRAAIRFNLTDETSLKAGFSRTTQYLHVVSNTLTISPIDIWKTSNKYIKPQTGNQVSLGLFQNWQQNIIETSVEVYYKTISNQLDYKDGAQLYLNETIETELLPTNGEAYGIELMVNKKVGRFTGWATYTFSRTFLQTDGKFEEEKINNNQKYPTSYDKPHALNLVTTYQVTRRLNLTTSFTYNTGRPFTASTGFYDFNGSSVPIYGARNQYRLPDYHRLDLSLTVLPNLKKNKKYEGSWNFAVYNLYARKNAYSIFYKHIDGSKTQAYQLSVIGTAIPSITYNFKF